MTVEKVSSPSFVNTALGYLGLGKGGYSLPDFTKIPLFRKNDNPIASSNQEPRSSEEKTDSAVKKANEANNNRMIAEINRSAEIDSPYAKLLTSYAAYNSPELTDFTKASDDTVYASYKRKSVEIKFSTSEDEKKQQDVIFDDGSQINYTTYLKDGKIKLNEEEFDIPSGTVVETKYVDGRMFSKLIQLPNMQKKVANIPEYLNNAEQLLKEDV